MIPSPEVKELSLGDYIKIVTKRFWIIVLLFVTAVFILFAYTLTAPNIYVAKTTVQLEKNPLELIDTKKAPVTTKRRWGREDFKTQVTLLESRFVAERVIDRLELPVTPKQLLRTVKVEAIPGTNMAVVSVYGRQPIIITEIANAWVREFIRRDLEINSGLAQYGVSKLEKQLEDTLSMLGQSERELNEFIQKHGDLAEQEEAVRILKDQEKRLNEELIEESAQYGPKHHEVVSLEKQIRDTRAKLEVEMQKYLKVQDKMATYDVLKKKTETYRSIYDDLIMRAKQLGTARGLAVSDIKIIDLAQVPLEPEPTLPIKLQILIVMGSLFFGVLVCFYMEARDTTLRTSEGVEFYARMPFLGYIPTIKKRLDNKKRCLISSTEPYSATTEAFRNIKTSLLFAPPEGVTLKTIMVSSSAPGEGKTLAACNLATVFAEGGHSTLLIDGDMRKGELADVFDMKKKKGLSDMLSGKASADEVIAETKVQNLSLITSGAHIPNPGDVLDSENFTKLFQTIEAKFDKIVIDVPAILSFSDCLYWESKTKALVLLIKAGKTKLDAIKKAEEKFMKKMQIKGAILNGTVVEQDLQYYLQNFQSIMKKKKEKKTKK